MEKILAEIDAENVKKTINLKSKPDKNNITFLETRSWWSAKHKIANDFLSSIVEGTHIVAHPSDQEEIGNLIKFDTIKIDIPFDHEIKIIKMKQSRCHDNSLLLATADKKIIMHSGYALSDDGLWRHHSWCMDEHGNIIETTVRRLIYVSTNTFRKNNVPKLMATQ